MAYAVNVDVERLNISRGDPNCREDTHRNIGAHYDITIHKQTCSDVKKRRVASRRERYWIENISSLTEAERIADDLKTFWSMKLKHNRNVVIGVRRCRRTTCI